MSRFTNFAENQLADFCRGQPMALPTNWSIRLASAADDTGFTELAGTGYAPVDVARSLTTWKSTQGNNLASTGTSHTTSNTDLINFGNAGGAWGTWSHTVIADDDGNAWAYLELPAPITINNGDPVSIAIGDLAWSLGLSGGTSDYLANKLIDLIFRAQAWTYPGISYYDLLSTAPNNAGGGTVLTGGGYASAELENILANWSSTDGPGETGLSAGTSGESSNNLSIVYPSPTASWATATHWRERDIGNNRLFYGALDAPVTVSAGVSAPRFSAGRLIRRFA